MRARDAQESWRSEPPVLTILRLLPLLYDLAPSYADSFGRLITYESEEEAESAPPQEAIRNAEAFREWFVLVLEREADGLLVPVVKPGSPLGAEPIGIPPGFRPVLKLHTHPEPLFAPSPEDVERGAPHPTWHGVAARDGNDLIVVLVNPRDEEAFGELIRELDALKQKVRSAARRYAPIVPYPPCGLDDSELLRRAVEIAERARAREPNPERALALAAAEVASLAKRCAASYGERPCICFPMAMQVCDLETCRDIVREGLQRLLRNPQISRIIVALRARFEDLAWSLTPL